MATITTYVCDVSGKSSTNKNEFVFVNVSIEALPINYDRQTQKLSNNYDAAERKSFAIHSEEAIKLGLVKKKVSSDLDSPAITPSLDKVLVMLLKDQLLMLLLLKLKAQIIVRHNKFSPYSSSMCFGIV